MTETELWIIGIIYVVAFGSKIWFDSTIPEWTKDEGDK